MHMSRVQVLLGHLKLSWASGGDGIGQSRELFRKKNHFLLNIRDVIKV